MEKRKLAMLVLINVLAFILIYFFISNDLVKKNNVLSEISLSKGIYNIWINIFLLFLFITLIILMILFFFYFANKIKSQNSRFILKLSTLVILVFIAFSMVSLLSTNTAGYGIINVYVTYYVTPVNNTGNGTVSYNTTFTSTIVSTSVNRNSQNGTGSNLENNTNISYSTITHKSTVTLSTSSNTTRTSTSSRSISHFNSFNIFFKNFSIFVVIFFSLLLILLYIRSSNSKRLLNEGKGEDVLNEGLLKEKQKIRKGKIIAEYLMISSELEKIGINPDYSLTPLEFEKESKMLLKNKQFAIITYYYELVRFSSVPITDDDIELFNKSVIEIYNEIDNFKSLKGDI